MYLLLASTRRDKEQVFGESYRPVASDLALHVVDTVRFKPQTRGGGRVELNAEMIRSRQPDTGFMWLPLWVVFLSLF
jgi:hypothetical protein